MGDFFLAIGLITLEHEESQFQDAGKDIAIQYELWSFHSLSCRKFGDECLKWKEEEEGKVESK